MRCTGADTLTEHGMSDRYAAAGAAVVASPRPYKQVVQHGAHGYIAETVEEWESALLDMLDNAPRRHRLRKNLRHHIMQKWSLRQNWQRWPLAWTEIIEDMRERQHAAARSSPLVLG
jgi:glycosyltransferase involved in cell wall biosynthesis